MVPCHHPGPGHGSRPGAIPTAPAVGNRRSSAPTAYAPNRDAAPGTGPGADPGAWSRGRAAAVGPEHGAGHSFLWPPPAAALEPRWPVTSPSPPCDNPSPSPRRHNRCRLTNRRGPLPLGPRPAAGASGARPPLPAPGGKPEMGPISPPTEYACSGHDLIFFVDTGFAHRMWEPRPGTPPGIDPPQKFYKQNMVGRRDLRAPTSGLVCGHPYLPHGLPHIVASWPP